VRLTGSSGHIKEKEHDRSGSTFIPLGYTTLGLTYGLSA
jgi:hypothetical protein